MARSRSSHPYEVNAMLWVSRDSEALIKEFLVEECGVRPNRVNADMHLTVYHGRRLLPELKEGSWLSDITIGTQETRFMVLAPGGENPRADLNPRAQSLGIRITKRNPAVAEIQRLRKAVYRHETPEVIGSRTPTTAWRNCFGSRHYQPHIKLLRSWSKIRKDLTVVGQAFRTEITEIQLDRFEVASRVRFRAAWIDSV